MSFLDSLRRFANSLPVAGDVGKQVWGDPDQEHLQEQFKQMQDFYKAYRPQMAQARMTGLGNQLSLFGPVNDMLKGMYGPGFGFDVSKLMQSPMDSVPGATMPHQVNSTSGRPLFQSNSPGPKVDDDKVGVAKL